MKIRMDFVTNSSSSSFVLVMRFTLRSGEVIKYSTTGSYYPETDDGEHNMMKVSCDPESLGKSATVEEMIEELEDGVRDRDPHEGDEGAPSRRVLSSGSKLIRQLSKIPSMDDISKITINADTYVGNGGENEHKYQHYTYDRDYGLTVGDEGNLNLYGEGDGGELFEVSFDLRGRNFGKNYLEGNYTEEGGYDQDVELDPAEMNWNRTAPRDRSVYRFEDYYTDMCLAALGFKEMSDCIERYALAGASAKNRENYSQFASRLKRGCKQGENRLQIRGKRFCSSYTGEFRTRMGELIARCGGVLEDELSDETDTFILSLLPGTRASELEAARAWQKRHPRRSVISDYTLWELLLVPPFAQQPLGVVGVQPAVGEPAQRLAQQQPVHRGEHAHAHQLVPPGLAQLFLDAPAFLGPQAGLHQALPVGALPVDKQPVGLRGVLGAALDAREALLVGADQCGRNQQVQAQPGRLTRALIAVGLPHRVPERVLPAVLFNGGERLVFLAVGHAQHGAHRLGQAARPHPAGGAQHAVPKRPRVGIAFFERHEPVSALAALEKRRDRPREVPVFAGVFDVQLVEEHAPVVGAEFLAVQKHVLQPVILGLFKAHGAVQQDILSRELDLDLPPEGKHGVFAHDEHAGVVEGQLLDLVGEGALLVAPDDDSALVIFLERPAEARVQLTLHFHSSLHPGQYIGEFGVVDLHAVVEVDAQAHIGQVVHLFLVGVDLDELLFELLRALECE